MRKFIFSAYLALILSMGYSAWPMLSGAAEATERAETPAWPARLPADAASTVVAAIFVAYIARRDKADQAIHEKCMEALIRAMKGDTS
ncbi:MAG: hypothetical protein ACE5HD_13090 [Acidobacteriota bacterium]